MSTEEVMQIVKERGLEIELRDGQPWLIKNGSPYANEKLFAVLKIHRERIIELLKE